MNKKRVPNVGEKYHFFEDGKSSPLRHYICTITKVVKFEDIKDTELLSYINKMQKLCYWLYATETDYVIYGKLNNAEEHMFIRTKYGGWFSIDIFCGGILDIDGSNYKSILTWWVPKNGYKIDYDTDSGLTKEDLEGVIVE